jgi:hypothetical protein
VALQNKVTMVVFIPYLIRKFKDSIKNFIKKLEFKSSIA